MRAITPSQPAGMCTLFFGPSPSVLLRHQKDRFISCRGLVFLLSFVFPWTDQISVTIRIGYYRDGPSSASTFSRKANRFNRQILFWLRMYLIRSHKVTLEFFVMCFFYNNMVINRFFIKYIKRFQF